MTKLRAFCVALALTSLMPSLALADFWTCRTQSRGRPFIEQAQQQQVARNRVIRDCTNDPYTIVQECRQNARCQYDGGPGGRPFTCDSFSRGLRFSAQDYDLRVAREWAVNRCSNYPGSWPQECRNSVTCYR